MLFLRLQGHQVNHIHDPDAQLRKMFAQDAHCSERLHGGNIARAAHHDVGIAIGVVARELENSDTGRAVLDGLVEGQPLQLRLLARDDDIDDVPAAQTLLETAKKELDRSRELGYAGNDPVYESLNNDISNLEKQLKGGNDTSSVFASLREKLNSFLKQQSQQERR